MARVTVLAQMNRGGPDTVPGLRSCRCPSNHRSVSVSYSVVPVVGREPPYIFRVCPGLAPRLCDVGSRPL